MRRLVALALLLTTCEALAQVQPSPVRITDGVTNNTVTTTTVATKRGLDVNVIAGGGGGGSTSVVSAGNSVTCAASGPTCLGAGGVFTGVGVDTLGYSSVSMSASSDVISATDGIEFQWSADNTNWSTRGTTDLRAARLGQTQATDLSQRLHDRYFRIRYTNGNTGQSFFRLQVVLRSETPAGDTKGVDQAPKSGDDAMLTKSVLSGRSSTGGGTYVDVKVTPSGSLTIAGDVTPSDAMPNPVDALGTAAFAMGWDSWNNQWARLHLEGSNFDGEAVKGSGVLSTEGYLKMFNGTTWDRVRGTIADGLHVGYPEKTGSCVLSEASPTCTVDAVGRGTILHKWDDNASCSTEDMTLTTTDGNWLYFVDVSNNLRTHTVPYGTGHNNWAFSPVAPETDVVFTMGNITPAGGCVVTVQYRVSVQETNLVNQLVREGGVAAGSTSNEAHLSVGGYESQGGTSTPTALNVMTATGAADAPPSNSGAVAVGAVDPNTTLQVPRVGDSANASLRVSPVAPIPDATGTCTLTAGAPTCDVDMNGRGTLHYYPRDLTGLCVDDQLTDQFLTEVVRPDGGLTTMHPARSSNGADILNSNPQRIGNPDRRIMLSHPGTTAVRFTAVINTSGCEVTVNWRASALVANRTNQTVNAGDTERVEDAHVTVGGVGATDTIGGGTPRNVTMQVMSNDSTNLQSPNVSAVGPVAIGAVDLAGGYRQVPNVGDADNRSLRVTTVVGGVIPDVTGTCTLTAGAPTCDVSMDGRGTLAYYPYDLTALCVDDKATDYFATRMVLPDGNTSGVSGARSTRGAEILTDDPQGFGSPDRRVLLAHPGAGTIRFVGTIATPNCEITIAWRASALVANRVNQAVHNEGEQVTGESTTFVMVGGHGGGGAPHPYASLTLADNGTNFGGTGSLPIAAFDPNGWAVSTVGDSSNNSIRTTPIYTATAGAVGAPPLVAVVGGPGVNGGGNTQTLPLVVMPPGDGTGQAPPYGGTAAIGALDATTFAQVPNVGDSAHNAIRITSPYRAGTVVLTQAAPQFELPFDGHGVYGWYAEDLTGLCVDDGTDGSKPRELATPGGNDNNAAIVGDDGMVYDSSAEQRIDSGGRMRYLLSQTHVYGVRHSASINTVGCEITVYWTLGNHLPNRTNDTVAGLGDAQWVGGAAMTAGVGSAGDGVARVTGPLTMPVDGVAQGVPGNFGTVGIGAVDSGTLAQIPNVGDAANNALRTSEVASVYAAAAGASAPGQMAYVGGYSDTTNLTQPLILHYNSLRVTGDRLHNDGTPDAAGTAMFVLPAISTAAAPTYGEGYDVALSTNLDGALRVTGSTTTLLTKAAANPVASAVSVGNTATALPASPLASRVSLCVYNNGASTMYLGASGVTTGTGFPIPAGGAWCDDVGTQAYYGIVAAGTVDARVIEN